MSANLSVRYVVVRSWARITLDRPDRYNALDTTAADELFSCLERGENDPSVRAVMLTGAGRAFSAGLDLRGSVDFAALRDRQDTPRGSAKSVDHE